MTPGYVEDEDEYNISKHLLEKFVCLIPVLGIVDGNTAIDLSILKFLKCHVYTWKTLFLYFKRKHIRNFDTAHSSVHKGGNHALKAHTAGIKPTMDFNTSAKPINTQTDIKVAALEDIIYIDVYFRHKRWSQLPTSPYTVSHAEGLLNHMMSRLRLYQAKMIEIGIFQVTYIGQCIR
jgi:hypothetical protein